MQVSLAKAHELSQLTVYDNECNETPWSLEDYTNSMRNSKHQILVAKLGSEVIGCIVISCILDEAEILQFWIKTNKQKHGYGRQLLKYAIQKSKLSGVNQIFLEVVSHNHNAISLYSQIGFKQANIRKNYYLINNTRYDAIVFWYSVTT